MRPTLRSGDVISAVSMKFVDDGQSGVSGLDGYAMSNSTNCLWTFLFSSDVGWTFN